ncbi:hypothetical protein EV360DRAFT_90984, partial [Lentinula raphanica]
QEIEAALEYFSYNSSSLPPSVYQFYQTLQTQLIAADHPTRISLLPQTQTQPPQDLHLPQTHVYSLPTPSPSPPQTFGVSGSRDVDQFSIPSVYSGNAVISNEEKHCGEPLSSIYKGQSQDALPPMMRI